MALIVTLGGRELRDKSRTPTDGVQEAIRELNDDQRRHLARYFSGAVSDSRFFREF